MVTLQLKVSPPGAFLDGVRALVALFCRSVAPESFRRAETVALAAHELLQNAISYSVDGDAELALALAPEENRIAIRVRSRSQEAEIARLQAVMAEMKAQPDPLANYLRSMERTMKAESRRGGLGLARIWYECQLEVAAQCDQGWVSIEAAGPLHPADTGSPP